MIEHIHAQDCERLHQAESMRKETFCWLWSTKERNTWKRKESTARKTGLGQSESSREKGRWQNHEMVWVSSRRIRTQEEDWKSYWWEQHNQAVIWYAHKISTMNTDVWTEAGICKQAERQTQNCCDSSILFLTFFSHFMHTPHDDHLEWHKAKLREQARLHHIEQAEAKAKTVLEDSLKRLAKTLNIPAQKDISSL